MGSGNNGTPEGTSLRGNTSYDVGPYRSSKSVYGRWRSAIPRIKKAKTSTKKPKHATCHMFAETTHVVAAPRGFARVLTPARRSYVFRVSLKSVQGLWSATGGRNLPFSITLAIGFYSSLYYRTTVQAVMFVSGCKRHIVSAK